MSGTLESDVNLPIAGTGANNIKIEGRDTAWGFNAGLLIEATDTTRLGLIYHSVVKYKLEGHTEVTTGANVPAAVLNNARYDASLSIQTPESWDFSVTQALNDAWTVDACATWSRWSRWSQLKDITVNNACWPRNWSEPFKKNGTGITLGHMPWALRIDSTRNGFCAPA